MRKWGINSGDPGGQIGANDVVWDGRASDGKKVSKGMYFAVIKAKVGGPNDRVILRIGVIH